MLNMLMIMGGQFINAGNYPPAVGWIQFISPNRYTTEGLLNLVVKDKVSDAVINEQMTRLGFNLGIGGSIGGLVLVFLMYSLLGFIVLSWRFRKY